MDAEAESYTYSLRTRALLGYGPDSVDFATVHISRSGTSVDEECRRTVSWDGTHVSVFFPPSSEPLPRLPPPAPSTHCQIETWRMDMDICRDLPVIERNGGRVSIW